MAKRVIVKIRETETTETFKGVWVETFWEKWTRRIQFKDIDPQIPLNKYSFPRRVYWTLDFYINCVWIPKLRGHQLYKMNYTVTMPKDRSKIGQIRRITQEGVQ